MCIFVLGAAHHTVRNVRPCSLAYGMPYLSFSYHVCMGQNVSVCAGGGESTITRFTRMGIGLQRATLLRAYKECHPAKSLQGVECWCWVFMTATA